MPARDSRQHGMAAKLLYVWAASTAALVMPDDVCSASVQQLPHSVLKALDELRSAAAAKAGGRGVKELSREEDATILVQHVRNRRSLREIKLPDRPAETAKTRWRRLKRLEPVLDDLRHAVVVESELPACTLDAELLDALRVYREGECDRGATTHWTFTQDACLLEQ